MPHHATPHDDATDHASSDEASYSVSMLLLAALLALCFLGRRSALLSWVLSWSLLHLRHALSWAMELVAEEDRSKAARPMAAEKAEAARITRLAAERAAEERAAAERAAAAATAASEAESRARATR
jgi:hypothetical protein